MPITLGVAAVNMAVALACGAVIGSERQVRQRMAGLRTNALVALGAAGFVVFSQLVINDASPTRVAAQVVSGIGFLGAGIIFRDGFNVHGLNTAATLWCSAAVGLIAGYGNWDFALLMTGMVVFVNLGLRPLVKFLKRHTKAGSSLIRHYRFTLTTSPANQTGARGLLVGILARHGLHLTEIDASSSDIIASVQIEERVAASALEGALAEFAADPHFLRAAWELADET